jgi:hypothetical protein
MIEVSGDGFEQTLLFTENDVADGFQGHCFNVTKPQGMVVQQKQDQIEFKSQKLDWETNINLQEGLNSLEFVFQTNGSMHSLVLIVNK